MFYTTLCLAFLGWISIAEGQATTMTETLDGCGSTKGCFKDPNDCDNTTCQYVVSYNASDTYVDFEVSARIASDNRFYVAMGLSLDQKMGEDSVVDCIFFDGTTTVQLAYNPRRSSSALSDATTGLSEPTGTFSDGIYTCSYRRDHNRADEEQYFDTSSTKYYILVARGNANSNTSKGMHSATNRLASSAEADFTSFRGLGGATDTKPLVRAHAAVMILAWALFAGFGIINARFLKTEWPGKKDCMGVQLWFMNHRGAMLCAFGLTVVGFVVIFVDVKGLSELGNESPQILQAHPILGIIVMALALLNPIMALFRGDKHAPKRWIFNWAHRMVGQIAFILAVWNIFLGIELSISAAFTYDWMLWVMVAYAALHCCTEILLLLLSCCTDSRNKGSNTMEMQATGEGEGHSGKSSLSLQVIILYVYSIITLGLVLAVVIGIAMA